MKWLGWLGFFKDADVSVGLSGTLLLFIPFHIWWNERLKRSVMIKNICEALPSQDQAWEGPDSCVITFLVVLAFFSSPLPHLSWLVCSPDPASGFQICISVSCPLGGRSLGLRSTRCREAQVSLEISLRRPARWLLAVTLFVRAQVGGLRGGGQDGTGQRTRSRPSGCLWSPTAWAAPVFWMHLVEASKQHQSFDQTLRSSRAILVFFGIFF